MFSSPKEKTPQASSSETAPSSSGDAAWLIDQNVVAFDQARRVRQALAEHKQTPGSPTPELISDWPPGHYSGDSRGRPDQPQVSPPRIPDPQLSYPSGIAPYPQGAKELADKVTGARKVRVYLLDKTVHVFDLASYHVGSNGALHVDGVITFGPAAWRSAEVLP